jgi:uncharacterized protein YeaO (DUF488 family)
MTSKHSHFPIKRVYEPAEVSDGARILVDRLWPRGVSKQDAHVALWLKDIAPSSSLRKWFGHDAKRWSEFRRKYRAELERNDDLITQVRDLAKKGPVTLIYSAHDQVHNQARVLADYLERGSGAAPVELDE